MSELTDKVAELEGEVERPRQKPVVWVRKRTNYFRCDANGKDFGPALGETFYSTQSLFRDIAEVREWHEPAKPEPEPVVWVYGVWDIGDNDCHWKRYAGFRGDMFVTARNSIEDAIRTLNWDTDAGLNFPPERTTTPAFSVRRLTEGEVEAWCPSYCCSVTGVCGAFRDGKYITDSCMYILVSGTGYHDCIKWVLNHLHPAITLAALPVDEEAGS